MAIKYLSIAIDDVGEKGLGAISTQLISRGELILAEAPILVIPHYETRPHEARQAIVAQFSSLAPKQRNEFFSLCNAFPATTAHEGIVKTTALPLKDAAASSAIFPLASRLNHSCLANAAYSYHAATKTLRIQAVKTIEPGAEITLNYLPETSWCQPSPSRRSYLLAGFNFLCHCPACAQPAHLAALSNMRRDSIARLTKATASTQLVISQPGRTLSYCQSILRLLNEEGETGILQFDPLFTASQVCAAHSDFSRAKLFLHFALRVRKVCQGDDGSAREVELRMLAEQPERHYLAGISRRWEAGIRAAPALGSPALEAWLWERAGDEGANEEVKMGDSIGAMVRSSLSFCSRAQAPGQSLLECPSRQKFSPTLPSHAIL